MDSTATDSHQEIQSPYPLITEIPGATDWFQRFTGNFITLEGTVVSRQAFDKDGQTMHRLQIGGPRVTQAFQLEGGLPLPKKVASFPRSLYFATTSRPPLGATIRLEIFPHMGRNGVFKIAHDSATISRNTATRICFQLMMAEIESSGWDLGESKTAVNKHWKLVKHVLRLPFLYKGQFKMTRLPDKQAYDGVKKKNHALHMQIKKGLRSYSEDEFKERLFHWYDQLAVNDKFADDLAADPNYLQVIREHGPHKVTELPRKSYQLDPKS